MSATKIKKELRVLANPQKAEILSRFFKTGKREYGEGDKFLGVVVPQQRIIAKRYKNLKFLEIEKLLYSKYHEERLTALLILTYQYLEALLKDQFRIYNFYIKHSKQINNWDLVDLAAPNIVGAWLFDKDRRILFDFAKSDNLWQRRIAIVSTFYFIRRQDYFDTIKLAKLLLNDKHDLIHKATGWMLREVGKNCGTEILIDFLNKYQDKMPRTMLRYAIEKLPVKIRTNYLKK